MLLENTTAWFICAYSIGFEQNNYLREELQKFDLERHQRSLYEQEDGVLPLLVSSMHYVRTRRTILSFVSVVNRHYKNKTILVSILYFCSQEYVHIK